MYVWICTNSRKSEHKKWTCYIVNHSTNSMSGGRGWGMTICIYIYTCNLQDLHNFLPYWQNQPFKSQPEFWGMSWFCIFKVCTPLEILNKRYQEIYHHNHPHFQAPMNQQGEAAPIIQWLKSGYLRSVQGLVVRKENQSLWITQTIEALIINHSTCPADAMQ